MTRLFLALLSAAGIAAGLADAAELRLPGPVYDPPAAAPTYPSPGVAPIYPSPVLVTPYYSWTGCYIGGNAGGIWTSTYWIDQIPGDTFFGADFGSHTVKGTIGGLQAGCNYQVEDWVFGLQGDYDWSSASADNSNWAFVELTDRSKIKSLASLTARTGFAWDCFLGYVKIGGASQKTDYTILSGFTFATAGETRSGWTVGIGGEYAFLKWLTGFAEYDYYNFGVNTNTFFCTACATLPAIAPVNIRNVTSVVKIGFNFKFGPKL